MLSVQITFTRSYQAFKPAHGSQPTATTTTKTTATATHSTSKATTSDCICDEDEFMGVGKGAYDEGSGYFELKIII